MTLVLFAESLDAQSLVRTSTPEGSVPVLRANMMQELRGDDFDYRLMASLAFARDDGRLLSCAFTRQDGHGTGFVAGVRRGEAWTFLGQDPQGAAIAFEEPGDVVPGDVLPFWLRARLEEREVLRVRLLGSFLAAGSGRPVVEPAEVRISVTTGVILDRKHFSQVIVARVKQAVGEDTLYFAPEFPHRLLAWRRADGGRLDARATHAVAGDQLDPASFRSRLE